MREGRVARNARTAGRGWAASKGAAKEEAGEGEEEVRRTAESVGEEETEGGGSAGEREESSGIREGAGARRGRRVGTWEARAEGGRRVEGRCQ